MIRVRATLAFAAVIIAACDPGAPGGVSPRLNLSAPQEVALPPSADTYIRESPAHANYGEEVGLKVRNAGNSRALLRWNSAELAGEGNVESARIELQIVGNTGNWGQTGQITLHRLTRSWSETGATWDCANAGQHRGGRADCTAGGDWSMSHPGDADPFMRVPSATAPMANKQRGVVTFDVTADVQRMTRGEIPDHGWIMKRIDERSSGSVEFGAREGNAGPRLVITRGTPAPTGPYHLAVIADSGVEVFPADAERDYPAGTRVAYRFQPRPGFSAVTVFRDEGQPVSAAGNLTMDKAHVLLAASIKVFPLVAGTEGFVTEARALLSSSNPVEAFQEHLDHVMTWSGASDPDAMGDALLAVYQNAFDRRRDSVALDRLDEALAGHTFSVLQPKTLVSAAPALDSVKTDSAEPTTYLYVNGINTGQDQALISARTLNTIVRAVVELNTPRAAVEWFYNRTRGAQTLSDPEKRVECAYNASRQSAYLDYPGWMRVFEACMGTEHFTGEPDLVEAIRQWIAVRFLPTQLETDALLLAQQLGRYHAAGRHVIVVPHSQGNLMLQQALVKLAETGSWKTGDSAFVGAVSLAAPSSAGWPLNSRHLIGEVVRGDLVADAGLNTWARTNTPLSETRDRVVEQFSWLGSRGPVSAYYGFFVLHSIDQSYFGQPVTRSRITSDLRTLYREATVGSTNCLLDEVQSLSFLEARDMLPYIEILNRNGGFAPGREVNWTSSAPGVLSVTGQGVVTARGSGSATLTARSWQATCEIQFTVSGGPGGPR